MRPEQHPEQYTDIRAIHPKWFGFYDRFLKAWKSYMPGIDRWDGDDTIFKDGTPWLQIDKPMSAHGNFHALIPFWFVPKEYDVCLSILQVASALSHTERGREPLAQRLIAVAPYVEVRMDKDSDLPGNRGKRIGEAMNSEVLTGVLKGAGIHELITIDMHSWSAFKALEEAGIECLNLTATPLFADIFRKIGFGKNSRDKLGALDIGALQRLLHLADLLGLNYRDQVAVFSKARSGHNKVDECTLLWGHPEKADNILWCDDIHDTGTSIGKSLGATTKYAKKRRWWRRKNIHHSLLMSHGVLSFPAKDNIKLAIENGLVDHLFLSDSLPKGTFNLRRVKNVEIVSVAPMLAFMARLVSAFSVKQILTDPQFASLQPYILQPRPKEEVWQEFYDQVSA